MAKPCEFRLEKYQKCHRCFRFYLPLQINASTGIINVHLVAGIRFIPTSFSILGYTRLLETILQQNKGTHMENNAHYLTSTVAIFMG